MDGIKDWIVPITLLKLPEFFHVGHSIDKKARESIENKKIDGCLFSIPFFLCHIF